jgi:excinuclease UvrABC helicase subunit UvrB
MEAIEDTSSAPALDIKKQIAQLEALMLEAAENLEFEKAAEYRDRIRRIEKELEN